MVFSDFFFYNALISYTKGGFHMKYFKKLFILFFVFAITLAPLNTLSVTYDSGIASDYEEEIQLLGDSPFPRDERK